eukprot:GFYU01024086.1.p1 GENE.GFYU01024086.1~~GFYU01024086.1.p1  ORF type:complete len:151 (+),score=0.34 GFYU01024086.1:37-453(+)
MSGSTPAHRSGSHIPGMAAQAKSLELICSTAYYAVSDKRRFATEVLAVCFRHVGMAVEVECVMSAGVAGAMSGATSTVANIAAQARSLRLVCSAAFHRAANSSVEDKGRFSSDLLTVCIRHVPDCLDIIKEAYQRRLP